MILMETDIHIVQLCTSGGWKVPKYLPNIKLRLLFELPLVLKFRFSRALPSRYIQYSFTLLVRVIYVSTYITTRQLGLPSQVFTIISHPTVNRINQLGKYIFSLRTIILLFFCLLFSQRHLSWSLELSQVPIQLKKELKTCIKVTYIHHKPLLSNIASCTESFIKKIHRSLLHLSSHT